MTGLAEDIAKVMAKAIAEIKKLSDDELKAFLAGEGTLKYVSPRHEVKLKPAPKVVELPVPSGEVLMHLGGAGSVDDATRYLTGLKFKVPELRTLAGELEVPLTGTTAKIIIADIVKVRVAGRITGEVVGRF